MSLNNNKNLLKNHPLTSQRCLLLEILNDAESHIDAKELYRRASRKDASICPATVYRSLNLFKELGLVNQVNLGMERRYYEIKNSQENYYFVCRECSKIVKFRNPQLEKMIDSVKKKHKFNVAKAELCLEGYCPDCDEKGKKD
jgi:Fur family transcriptional regulator, ferric uptake regulator